MCLLIWKHDTFLHVYKIQIVYDNYKSQILTSSRMLDEIKTLSSNSCFIKM